MLGKKQKREEVKQWFCTWPRCDLELNDALKLLREAQPDNIRDYLIAREHHEDGGYHLHAYVLLKKKRRFRENLFDIGKYHGHYEPCRNYKKVIIYCKKEEDYICNFAIELSGEEKVAMRNKELRDGDINELVDNGKLSMFSVPQVYKARQILNLNKVPPKIIPRVCFWIYGKPRIGKSYLVRDGFDPYEKSLNKWWDGYNGQDIVLIDDLDEKGKCLDHYIKIWADNYRFLGEVKCGTMYPSYRCLIVTSNYYPKQIWMEDAILSEAITSRFEMIEMTSRDEQEMIINKIKEALDKLKV